MFKRAVESYRRLNKPGVPEESIPFRVAVLLTVLISAFAAIYYGSIGAAVGVPVIAGILIGFYFSYKRRTHANLLLKLIITVLLLVVFVLFWSELNSSINDLRYPLVRLFLWLQVLHSFDLPTRRDLDFSLLSSTILIAFAGSLSISTGFLYLLIPFFIAGAAALYLGHRSALKTSGVFVPSSKGKPTRAVVLASLLLVPLTIGLFILLPRLPGFSSNFLPVSSMRDMASAFEGLIKNPGYNKMPDTFPDTPLPFNRNAYQGFSRYLDLRMRGVPSDRIVMKVRSNQPEYWRATAFDRFLGNGWENSEKEKDFETLNSNSLPMTVSYPKEPGRYATRELVQTFFVQEKLPNTLFAAYLPRDVFFPTRVLKVDSMMSVLTPVILDRGLIYTVISEVSVATPDMLRQGRGPYPENIKDRYTQLPKMSGAVAELAASVCADATNNYDKVVAMSDYLQKTYPYDLNVKKQDPKENSVEFFLFKAKKGFCEHFASALTVMCRTQGIPARVVAGYDTGQMNPLTGYYEVTARDSHAWVEVYFPMFGWIQFDPTPGWNSPTSGGQKDTWSGFSLFQYIGRGLSHLLPGSVINGFKSAGKAVGGAFSAVAKGISDHWKGILLVAIAAGLIAAGFILYRRRRPSSAGPGPPGPRDDAVSLYERLASALTAAGLTRKVSTTPLELAGDAESRLGIDTPLKAVTLFNKARYSAAGPGPGELDGLRTAVDAAVEDASATAPPDMEDGS